MRFKEYLLVMVSTAMIAGCSKVQVSDNPSTSPGSVSGLGGGDNGGGSPGTPSPHAGEVHDTSATIQPPSQKVDLLLVIDDSTSMKPDALSLGSKLEGFLQKLEAYSLDWQLCMTTTDYDEAPGESVSFAGNTRTEDWILKKGDANVSDKVVNTLNNMTFGGGYTGDERGVAAMNAHLGNRSSNHCYRAGAAVSTIVISDEDERSVGGNQSLDSRQYAPIEQVDQPDTYISTLHAALGQVALTSHSIIVMPNDQSCLAEQNNQGYPSFVGTFYNKLSVLTGGSVGSICSSDFSQGLSVFADQIQKSFQRVSLYCEPAAGWTISTSPVIQNVQAHVEGSFLILDSQVSQSTVVNVHYTCK